MTDDRRQRLQLPKWWYLAPAYLTAWSVVFSTWTMIDPEGLFDAFGVDTGGAAEFILLNSAARYVGIAAGLVIGVWVLRTFASALTALAVRLAMDVGDLYAGLRADVITDATGVIQSLVLFLIPGSVAIVSLLWLRSRADQDAQPHVRP